MQVSPQKANSEKKYLKALDVTRKVAIVAAGAAVVSATLGFIWYSDIPQVRMLREDYSLSEVFPTASGVLNINGDENNTVKYNVINYSDSDYHNVGSAQGGKLFVQGISIVRFTNIKADALLVDEYISSLMNDYDLLDITGGCVLVPKNNDGYFVALPNTNIYNRVAYNGGMNQDLGLDFDYIE